MKIPFFIKKLILQFLYETKALTFETFKSPTHFEQYTKVRLFGEEILQTKWTELEKIFKPF